MTKSIENNKEKSLIITTIRKDIQYIGSVLNDIVNKMKVDANHSNTLGFHNDIKKELLDIIKKLDITIPNMHEIEYMHPYLDEAAINAIDLKKDLSDINDKIYAFLYKHTEIIEEINSGFTNAENHYKNLETNINMFYPILCEFIVEQLAQVENKTKNTSIQTENNTQDVSIQTENTIQMDESLSIENKFLKSTLTKHIIKLLSIEKATQVKNKMQDVSIQTENNTQDVSIQTENNTQEVSNVNTVGKNGYKPLHCAVKMGNLEMVKYIIGKEEDVNAQDEDKNTPLHYAVKKCHKEIVEYLISKRADVNAQDQDGKTPLHWAAAFGHKEIVERLIEGGADVNAQDQDGNTPLHRAALYGHKEIVEYLIRKEADINVKDKDDKTPLHQAVIYDRRKTVKYLIEEGADIDAVDKDGKTALHYANNSDLKKIFYNRREQEKVIDKNKSSMQIGTVIDSMSTVAVEQRSISSTHSH